MYTVIWQELNGNDYVDRWDRFETKEEVKDLLNKLVKNPDVCENDVWIFTPEADKYAVEYNSFE